MSPMGLSTVSNANELTASLEAIFVLMPNSKYVCNPAGTGLDTDTDVGRFVATRRQGVQVLIERETASGQLLESVRVPPSLDLSDAAHCQG